MIHKILLLINDIAKAQVSLMECVDYYDDTIIHPESYRQGRELIKEKVSSIEEILNKTFYDQYPLRDQFLMNKVEVGVLSHTIHIKFSHRMPKDYKHNLKLFMKMMSMHYKCTQTISRGRIFFLIDFWYPKGECI